SSSCGSTSAVIRANSPCCSIRATQPRRSRHGSPSRRADTRLRERLASASIGHPPWFRTASVPLPTFVSLCSPHFYERRKQRDTSNSMILVWLRSYEGLAARLVGTSNPPH